jgi:hypothetical protein
MSDWMNEWAAKREQAQRETLERLERGLQPRNTSEAAIAFVHGFDVRQNPRISVNSILHWSKDRPQLYSYATPIAFVDGDAIYEGAARYSNTTGKHLSQLQSALIDAGYVMDVRDCRLAPDDVYGGWLDRERTPFVRWVKRENAHDYDINDYPVGSLAWVSSNGKRLIIENRDSVGASQIPYVILGDGRWTLGYVLANGDIVQASSQTIPAYVRHAVADLMGGV